MRLYCHCLNTSIEVLKTIDDKTTLAEFVPADLGQYVNNLPEWIVGDVATDQIVQTVWPSLMQSKSVRELKLHRCMNCQLYTHVTNLTANRILINRDLFNETNVQYVYADPNYSTITKILLPIMVDNSVGTSRLSNSQDEQQQLDSAAAQRIYRQSVEEAERDTENRIQMYQREQEQLLAAKTDHLNRELNLFLELVRSVTRNGSSTKTSPTSSSYINENSTESGFGSDIFDIGAMDSIRTTSTNDRGFSDRLANSDDETNDDPMLDNRGWSMENSNVSNFATSLPQAIALRPMPITNENLRQDVSPDDLERIGKSFRDLSRSMCTDGTEVFGELPSPRLNTRHT